MTDQTIPEQLEDIQTELAGAISLLRSHALKSDIDNEKLGRIEKELKWQRYGLIVLAIVVVIFKGV